jgi:GPH family glycoside/pentoside/hexuronide:cation symporter
MCPNMEAEKPIPIWRMIMYSAGGFGTSLMGYVVGTLLPYFYLPPETGRASFPVLIDQRAIFLGMTVVGLSSFVCGLLGMIANPVVGPLSDRSRSRLGRRSSFMLVAILPYSVLGVAVFAPPLGEASAVNAAWVFVASVLFNIASSIYLVPWNALMPELGRSSRRRMLFSTFGSLAWAFGFIAGNAVFPLKDLLESAGMSPIAAFRAVTFAFAGLAGAAMLLPVLFVQERKWGSGKVSEERRLVNIKLALSNVDFVVNASSTIVYQLADRLLQLGMVYFITILIGLPEAEVFTLGAAMFGLSFVWYPFVLAATRKIPKKPVLMLGYALQCLSFAFIAAARSAVLPQALIVGIVIFLQSLVGAITGILPAAIGADVIRADTLRTGIAKEASFGGAASLLSTIPSNLPGLLFPSLLLLGRSLENPAGVLLVALVGAAIMMAAILVFAFYNEKRTLATLAELGEGASK